MLRAKPCHQGLQPRSRIFGLEPLDTFLLFPPLFVCVVLLDQIVLGVAVTVLLGVAIRVAKWDRLPGYTLTVLRYLALPQHNGALGHDDVPPYPSKEIKR
ncbi:hypothetical protein ACFL6C_07765 [Myxococcota bacterium]